MLHFPSHFHSIFRVFPGAGPILPEVLGYRSTLSGCVQPAAYRLHGAQGSYECSPTHYHKYTENKNTPHNFQKSN